MDTKNTVKTKEPVYLGIQKKSKAFYITYAVLMILVIIFAGEAIYSTYVWQHKKVVSDDQKVSSLNSELSQKNSQSTTTNSNATTAATFTYTPSLSGLSLTLPKASYAVIVGADGNDGGAPGLAFKVVNITANNIYQDAYFTREVEIDTDVDSTSLTKAVSSAETNMVQNGDCSTIAACGSSNFSVSNTTVAGLAGKLIIAKTDEYGGNINVYVVISGGWGYEITAGGLSSTNTPSALLTAVLNGLTIKPAIYPQS
jgi:hypothetical protein